MRRRELILCVFGAALLQPVAALAQQMTKRRMIATLSVGSQAAVGQLLEIFRQALGGLGYGDDKIVIESRWADGNADRLPSLAAELARLSPDVIVSLSNAAVNPLKQAAANIPIVMAVSDDPVGQGLVASLAHPGGNVTGLSFAQEDTVGRELQLLETMVPGARRVAVLADPKHPAARIVVRALQRAAADLRTEIVVAEADRPAAIEPAFASMKREGAAAVVVLGGGLFTTERKRIVSLAAKHRLPAIYHDHIFVEDGGLMSYGGDHGDNYRRAAVLVDKILKGARPADLPVEEPMKFYLYINLRTASTLGLTVPPTLLAQADEVIE